MTNGGRSAIRHVVARAFGIAAAATALLSLAPSAQALSLSNPATAPAARQASDAVVTQVQHRGRGGGFHGGGGSRGGGHAFHGGGFRGGGAPAFRGGGGFRAAAPVFRGGGGGFRPGPAFHGGGFRYGGPAIARRSFSAPVYYGGYRRHIHRHRYVAPRYYGYAGPRYYSYSPRYYAPRRFCRVIWTYYGPRKICRYRPWHHRHWHHRRHHRFNIYW